MSFVRTGLPSLSVHGHSARDTQIEAPFLDGDLIDHDQMVRDQARKQASAGRWLDIVGACAITLCICAWIAIRIAAN